ncbi:MAG: aminoglycoside phosphotransferase family protein [Actinomycetota bacterium]|nr:aminoglycoside phosphotransferase family protein [Actinomycetota bacterium]
MALLDTATAQRMVDAAGLGFEVHACARLHGGDNSAAFDLYDRGRDAHLVAKVYGERLAWKMGKEVLVYGLLNEAPVPTPEILFADASRGVVDAAYVLMTRLDGTVGSRVTPTAAQAEIEAIFRQVGEAARGCHTVVFDRFGYIGPTGLVDPCPDNRTYMSRQFERHLRGFRDAGGDRSVAAAIERRIADDEPLVANCHEAVLCHDDLHEQNVLLGWGPEGWVLTGVIDVENAVAADPLLDLAKTDYYAREDPVRRAGLLEGYGPLPPDAEARLALYRLHHALALWSWFAQIGRTAALPGISADVARLVGASR